ncbi:ABC transporter ATP-binding protein [Pradoshia sp. D12]|uniref:ABC transporter ATP-binding protein n=1 Tax=Bacillaceae TaxID=186817 RepID=UPI00112CF3DB|nr:MULTISPECIES: ABC transporter ATP-binding protein [Bacillaceae]QFK71396.1 ABC transporter ATP-binding protein [Pradoshia sp. D12]TPF73191.1 ABC transporter ATP-binding protein [Bacillus sp. D12]
MSSNVLLNVTGLKTSFKTERGNVSAVKGVDFQIKKGEVVGLVGESGCGKSVTAQSIMRLFDEDRLVNYEGKVELEGENLLEVNERKMQDIRGNDISMIFQDPISSLNPLMKVGDQIKEALVLHRNIPKSELTNKVVDLLRLTGIPSPEKRIHDYPHKFSGGMRQRIMIAIALACKPKLLIADEPTTALDVTIQSQIIKLIMKLNKELDMAILMITHDLGVVAEICDRVIVMYMGQVVEEADAITLFSNPKHPYTIGLLKSIPDLKGNRKELLHIIPGMVPSLFEKPAGCSFAPRCPIVTPECTKKNPPFEVLSENHRVRCLFAKEGELYATE